MAFRFKVPVQNATLSIRLFAQELETIKKAAKTADKSMADWVRETCLARAKRAIR